MAGGVWNRLVRVDLSKNQIKDEPLDEKLIYNFLGGRGYAAKLLFDELRPATAPLSAENKLIFMTGPLTGTSFPGAGRISVSSKSPLTNTIFDSSVGGNFGAFLKKSGIDGLVVEGASEKPVYILIDDGNVSLENAEDLWGKSTGETEKVLLGRHPASQVIAIGPAGENLSQISNFISGKRAAGRGGLGAVAGHKKLKAIVAKGTKKIPLAHPEVFDFMVKRIRQLIDTHPVTGKDGALARFGTSLLIHRIAAAKMLPVDDFVAKPEIDYNRVDAFSGETVKEKYLVGQGGCFGCPTRCGREVKVDGVVMKGPEYESTAMLGPNSGFYNYGEIAQLSVLCDELGLDTISAGNRLGAARAAGHVADFTQAKNFIENLASGAEVWAAVKGLELPAYDPRCAKGIALAYATSNRGGCHLRAFTIAPEIIGIPEFSDPSQDAGKALLVKNQQDAFAVYDSAALCKFHSFALFSDMDFRLKNVALAIEAATGFHWDNLKSVGERTYNLERMFNEREGFSRKDDALPERFGLDINNLLDEYYKLRGWDTQVQILLEPVQTRAPKIEPALKVNVPDVQVALDLDADVKTIADIARKCYEGGSRVIEAGTPALKRHGCDTLIPALRKAAPDAIIVADTKTMDVGHLEASIAYRAGADVVALLAIGSKNKVREALSEAIKWDRMLLIDFIQCEDPVQTLREYIDEFSGYEDRIIFCMHKGISEQLKGRGIHEEADLIKKLREVSKGYLLAVAGGIKQGVAKDVASWGADILIVGSAVYNSSDPKATTELLLKEARDGRAKRGPEQ